MAGSGIDPDSFYVYDPNKGWPVFFCVAFLATGIFHLVQCIRLKCFKVTLLLPVTSFIFAVGFAVREYGAFNVDNLAIYIASTIIIYTAPPLVELANYHILGRLFYYVPYCAPLHPGRTLTTFGMVSAIIEVLNGTGVAQIANVDNTKSLKKVGHILLRTSLILQVVVIVCFVVLVALFQRRCVRRGTNPHNVQASCITMYTSAALIFVRCVYRTVEYFSLPIGTSFAHPAQLPHIMQHEWYFYVFEASVLLVNSVLWNVRHPRHYLPQNYHIYLAQDGKTELVGAGWKDNRPFLITVLDPFGLCARRQSQQKPFWENAQSPQMESA